MSWSGEKISRTERASRPAFFHSKSIMQHLEKSASPCYCVATLANQCQRINPAGAQQECRRERIKESNVIPRPKGSKNKKTVCIQENVEDKIAAVEAEIAELGTQLKAKKAELKQLVKAKAESDRIAAERKVEEDKKAILDAVEKSGKSLEEILEMLGK